MPAKNLVYVYFCLKILNMGEILKIKKLRIRFKNRKWLRIAVVENSRFLNAYESRPNCKPAVENNDKPVLQTGSPSKSNKSCRSGFFTAGSTSQSLPSAGLRFTSNNHGLRFSSISTSKP